MKYKTLIKFNIAKDVNGKERFTDEEIKFEIDNDGIEIKRGIIYKKRDGDIIGILETESKDFECWICEDTGVAVIKKYGDKSITATCPICQ